MKANKSIQILNRFSLLFHFLLSISVCFCIEWISRHSFTSAAAFAVYTPCTFLYNSALIFLSLLFVYPFRIRAFLRFFICTFWLILGITNGVILANRVTPFNFTDLKMLKDVFALKNNYFSTLQMVLLFAALALLGVFLLFFAVKGPRFQGKLQRFPSIICIIAAFVLLPTATSAAVSANVLSDYYGNLAQGYEEYGFIYSFSSSVVERGMKHPNNYSEKAVASIRKKVEKNVKGTALKQEDMPNIICVQLESFVDPSEFTFLKTSKDACPNFRYLKENFSSGYLTVPVIGAGTANTEFEVLTGMSIEYFGLGEYPYKTVMKTRSCESIASDLSALGYRTHAVHNNGGNFYGRAEVFSQLGFDTFISEELMDATDYNEMGTWAKDAILSGEIEKCLDSGDGSDFVYTITVQSHGSYLEQKIFENPEITVSGGQTAAENNQWEYYVNEICEVDRFIGNLIDRLSKRDENTIVVFFGDHLPTMGLEESDVACGNLYCTEYVTWNNFGMEKEDADLTTYQLMAKLTGSIGIHEGTIFSWHQYADAANLIPEKSTFSGGSLLSPDTGSLYKRNLELLQYDLLYGERYCYKGEDLFPASDLEMGVSDVLIQRVHTNAERGIVRIYGKNFTPSSKVYINNAKVSTAYVSDKCLQISLGGGIKNGSILKVCQVGSGDTIFRTSNTWRYSTPNDNIPKHSTSNNNIPKYRAPAA